MKQIAYMLLASILLAACAAAPHPATVPVAGGSVFVDDRGRVGVPVVFIHGNGGSTEQWRAQLEHFRRSGRRAVAIDLPGFGKSTTSANADVSLDAMATAIDQAVNAIHLNRFVIVGHSYGGAVVAKYAATHPEKVAGVVYLDAAATAVTLTQQQRDQFTAGLRANKMGVVHAWFAPMLKPSSDRVRDEVFASVERTPIDPFIGALISLGAYDPQTLVNAYHGPRLAIAAADIESPASFQKQFPEIEAVRISGAGHWLMLDKPDEVNAALDAFLKKVR